MKRLSSILAICILCLGAYAQSQFNKILDLYGTGFNFTLHPYINGDFVALGLGDIDEPNKLIISRIDANGEIVYSEEIGHDSLSLNINRHNSSFIEDSLLYVIGSGQYITADIFKSNTYFIRYNLESQEIEHFEVNDEEDPGSGIISCALHSDNHIYAFGIEFVAPNIFDLVLHKFNKEGEIIWTKTMDFDLKDMARDIISYNNRLFLCSTHFTDTSYASIAEVDTSGQVVNSKFVVYIGPISDEAIRVSDSIIYYTGNLNEDVYGSTRQYIGAFDLDLNLLWEKTIDSSDVFGLELRHTEVIGDQILTLGNIHDVHTLNDLKIWSYVASYSIYDGETNWEQVMYYDSNYIHHLNDIVEADNGDLVLMGTYFPDFLDPEYDQYLWLIRTDSLGCSIDKEVCYDTFEEYFSSYLPVSVEDVYYQEAIKVYPNPLGDYLNIESSLAYNIVYRIIDMNGQLMHSGLIGSSEQIDTADWVQGVYFMQYVTDKGELMTRKLIKN